MHLLVAILVDKSLYFVVMDRNSCSLLNNTLDANSHLPLINIHLPFSANHPPRMLPRRLGEWRLEDIRTVDR